MSACRAEHALASILFWILFGALAWSQDAAPRSVHVFVALADNQHQGIVPVPAHLGNRDDPGPNLYWGSAYGVKTFFARSADWLLLTCGARARLKC
ncbi:MAG: hypothetical protein ABSF59_02415 [Candidatus Sulfotelmatobacter sp.]|jgi:hypothetical protein